jgi:hypothetical protein
MLFHPFTGELIEPDDLEALEQAEADLSKYLSGFGVYYGVRRDLRAAIAAKRKMAKLPPPRYRSDVQQRVSECPRCGGRPHDFETPFDAPAVEVVEKNPFHEPAPA